MLNHNLVGRGSFLRCRHFGRELVRRGHEVHLYSAADRLSRRWVSYEDEGVQVHLPPRWGKVGSHDGGYAPIDILARIPTGFGDWDLIHAFEHRPNVALPMLAGLMRRTPVLSDWSDWWTKGGITSGRRRFSWVDRWEGTLIEEGTKRLSDRVVVVSRALWDRAIRIGIPESRLDLIPSGCDVDRIQPRDKQECRRELGLAEAGPILGFVGFAFWDFEFMLQAFVQVRQRFPDARMLVVGHDKDSRVTELVGTYLPDAESAVIFLGQMPPDQLGQPLGAADIHLLPLPDNPANQARWPIKVGDYLASGRPTVACRVGDAAVLLDDRGAGLATDPNPRAFAEGILELLNQPQLANEMGRRARETAESLSWAHQAERLESAYLSCLVPE